MAGGRPKGSINKKTLWLGSELKRVGLSWGNEFKTALEAKDYKKAEILTALLPYLNPKIRETDVKELTEDTPAVELVTADVMSIVGGK